MKPMDEKKREAFLAKTRLGILTTLTLDGAPTAVPIWFDWDGTAVSIFTDKSSQKVKRLQNDPRASMLVVNDIGEPEAWILFEGKIEIKDVDTSELMTKLAHRYWDMTPPETQAVLQDWLDHADQRCLLHLKPEKIRSLG
ncbi:MAG: TIGR03618 family F420-dependent PPOX class oxidoreductase [Chloroflexota bacterium]